MQLGKQKCDIINNINEKTEDIKIINNITSTDNLSKREVKAIFSILDYIENDIKQIRKKNKTHILTKKR